MLSSFNVPEELLVLSSKCWLAHSFSFSHFESLEVLLQSHCGWAFLLFPYCSSQGKHVSCGVFLGVPNGCLKPSACWQCWCGVWSRALLHCPAAAPCAHPQPVGSIPCSLNPSLKPNLAVRGFVVFPVRTEFPQIIWDLYLSPVINWYYSLWRANSTCLDVVALKQWIWIIFFVCSLTVLLCHLQIAGLDTL